MGRWWENAELLVGYLWEGGYGAAGGLLVD
jgi:hypothetical protein